MSILHLRMSVFCFVVLLCFTSVAAGEASAEAEEKNDKIKVNKYQPQEFNNKDQEDDFLQNMDSYDAAIITGIVSHEKEQLPDIWLRFPTRIINEVLSISDRMVIHGGSPELIKTQVMRAMALLYLAHDMQKIQGVAFVNAIGDLCPHPSQLAADFVLNGGSPKDLTLRFAFHFTKYLLRQIADLPKPTNFEDQFYSLNEAKCYHSLSLISSYMGNPGDGIHFSETGISRLQKNFGESASSYGIYSSLVNDLGLACYESHNYEDSVKYYLQSLNAVESCLYGKCTDVTAIQNGLKMALSKLKAKQSSKPEL